MNKKSIRVLRGSRANTALNKDNILPGQPIFDKTDNYLFVGSDDSSISQPITTNKVKGYFADKDVIQSSKSDSDSYYIGPSADGDTLDIQSSKPINLGKLNATKPSDIVVYNNGIKDVTLLDIEHPVYSIFETTDPNMDTPQKVADYFGGAWELFGAGRVTVAYDPDDSDFNTVGHTDGEKSHILSVGELAQHNHDFNDNVGYYVGYTSQGGVHKHTIYSKTLEAAFAVNNSDDDDGGNHRLVEGIVNAYEDTVQQVNSHHPETDNYQGYATEISLDLTHDHTELESGGHNHQIKSNGCNLPHNNLQPYIVVYRYRRTA